MAQFTINGFARGMDLRRPSWAASESTLRLAEDVVLTDTGDVEVRKAFSVFATLPASTKGLRDVDDNIVTFGMASSPTMPTGISYEQQTSSDGEHIEQITSSDVYDGKVYLSALMSDGSQRHYYDGVEVADWFDGRARASFTVVGGDGAGDTVDRVDVDGVDVLGSAVTWTTSNAVTAAAIATQINSHTSSPDYDAVAVGETVFVLADESAGETANGLAVSVTVSNDMAVTAPGAMLGGVDNAPTPGEFVRTHDYKVYSPSGRLLNFSGIDGPTFWNTDSDGAGFSDLSRTQSGSERLLALEAFLEEIAVFARKCIQIWHVEADDLNNRRVQTFRDVGTESIRAQAQFRGTDVFFADRHNGIVAIVPSRTEQTFAELEPVGAPIRGFLNDYKATLTDAVITRALAFVEPGDARFWYVLGERVFVYSWHKETGVEGWTYFSPGFQIEDVAIANGRVYVRSGNTVYLYGGANNDEYPPADVGVITFSAFRASAPERVKGWGGIDFGVEGTWEARLYSSDRDTTGRVIATIARETFEDGDVGTREQSANPILKMTRKSTGYARVCQLVVNYSPMHSG